MILYYQWGVLWAVSRLGLCSFVPLLVMSNYYSNYSAQCPLNLGFSSLAPGECWALLPLLLFASFPSLV